MGRRAGTGRCACPELRQSRSAKSRMREFRTSGSVGASGEQSPEATRPEIPVYGHQEQSAYNGHFESTCYHLWFVKIKLRVVCQTLGVLRSSNSNYRGSQKSGSVKLTSRKCAQNPECQSRRANPRTIRQEQSAAPQDGLGGDCVAVMQAAYPRHGYHLAALPRCRRWNSACRRVLG